MKKILLAGLLCIIPVLHADPISGFVEFSSFSIDAKYQVVAGNYGISSQGFVNSDKSLSNTNSWLVTYRTNFNVPFNPLPENAVLTSANLNLSYLLGNVLAFAAPYVSYSAGGTHPASGSGYQPGFSGADPLQVAFSISNGTITQDVADIASSVDLLTNFSNDLLAGNDLTVNISVSETFNRTRPASGDSSAWRNTTATYNLNRTVQSARFEAAGDVNYTVPSDEVPEPLTLPLSGAGLVAFACVMQRRKKA